MRKDGDPTDPRNGLLELLQAFADQLRGQEGQAGNIAARVRKAGDEPARDRISSCGEDNGDGTGRLLCGQGRGCA